MDSSKLWYASSGIWGGVAAAVAGLAGIAGYTITPADQAAMADSIAQTVTLISSLTAVGGGLLAIFGRARVEDDRRLGGFHDDRRLMSGALGALASLGPIAKAVEAVANAFGLQVQRKATAEERDAGATAAEDETALDTAEIADEQARINTEHPAALDIARELRADADEAERGGKV